MRTLRKDKKPLYICHRIENSEPVQFEPPVKQMLNTVATMSEADKVALGEEYKEYRKATIPVTQSVNYNNCGYREGDRAYIFNTPPEVHDPLCDGCDFEVKSVLDSLTIVTVLFKRLQNGEE